MSSQAAPAWISTNGLVRANPTTASAPARPSAFHLPHPATITGTAAIAPGYLADAARPTASPAHSMRPPTASASTQVTASVSSTSVTAIREYATWVVATATAAAPTIAAPVPYARRPSHHVAPTPPSPSATATKRAARNDGPPKSACTGASTAISRDG